MAKADERLAVRRGASPQLMPCALCGELLPHQIVDPVNVAKLCFRASLTMRADGGVNVWLPSAHDHRLCPDPPTSTARLWANDEKRESYKREHLAAVLHARTRAAT